MQFTNADGRCIGARLQHPGRRRLLHPMVQVVVIEDADEFWHKQISFAGADPHGELVAEEVRCRLAEAG